MRTVPATTTLAFTPRRRSSRPVAEFTNRSALDPRIPPEKKARGDYTASQAIVLACKPYDWIDEFPKTNVASPELRAEVLAKWKDFV